MADATIQEIAERVLQKLSVLERGETAEHADQLLVMGIIASVNEELRDDEICYWSDEAFPQSIKEAFSDYVACFTVGDFPSQKNKAKYEGEANENRFLRKLARLSSSRERVDRPTKADYF